MKTAIKRIVLYLLLICLFLSCGLLISCGSKTAVKNITGLELNATPTVVNYDLGEELDLAGLSIKVIFKKATEVRGYEDIAEHLTVSGYDKNALGEQTVTVTYKVSEKKNTYEGAVSFNVTVAHTFNIMVANAEFLKTPATCTDKAVYYVSCACGEKGSETFTHGEVNPANHASTAFTYTANGDGTHTKKNVCCGAVDSASEACSGGTATVDQKAVCASCGGEYGETLHAHDYVREIAEERFLKTPATCEQKAVYYKSCACGEHGTETFVYGGLATHIGGTATCTDLAVCTQCHTPYGELAPNNHSANEFNYTSNNNGTHTKKYVCCGATAAEGETCNGGEATCQQKAECQYCHVAYGNLADHRGGTATCQTKALCSVCGNEYGELASHDYGAAWEYKGADGHAHICRTAGCTQHDSVQTHRPDRASATEEDAVVCLDCGYIITAALGHTTHTPAETWSSNENHHWKECIGCNTQQMEKAEHIFDDDCDTVCNTCGYVRAVPHDYELKHSETQHWYECRLCNVEKPDSRVSHAGGTATCVDLAVCSTCGEAYGSLAPDNHTLHTYGYVNNGDGTHEKTHLCCGAVADAHESCYGGTATCKEYAICTACSTAYGDLGAHTELYPATCTEMAYCSECNQNYGDKVPHRGGTATCKSGAVCEVCHQQYGEFDPENHASEVVKYRANYDGTHSAYHDCCNTPTGDAPIPCEGTAQSCIEQHKCSVCLSFYGEYGAHRGGTATCQSPAICDVCHKQYGELGNHSLDLENWGYKGADGHAHICTVDGCAHKDAVVAHTPNIGAPTEEQAQICTECGYIIAPKTSHAHTAGTEMGYNADGHFLYCQGCYEQVFNTQSHVYTNACDATCNVCGYIREVGAHNYVFEQITSITHAMRCSVCRHVDQDTVEYCTGTTRDCNEMYPYCDKCHETYRYFGNYDDLTVVHQSEDTRIIAAVGGEHKIVHDCCSVLIRYEDCSGGTATCVTKAQCEHCGEYYGEFAPHTLGTPATCQSPAICAVCEQTFGEKNYANHASEELIYVNEVGGIHEVRHKCCVQAIRYEAHSGGEATCTAKARCEYCEEFYGEYAPHTGGEATCKKKAVCEVCHLSYGSLDPENHTSEEFIYISNGDGTHTKKHNCCNAVIDEAEACSGGTATCKVNATCEQCKSTYGSLDPENHASEEFIYTSNGDGTHIKKHKCCNEVVSSNETCSGGEATCKVNATCEQCKSTYGSLDTENHASEEFTYTSNGDGTHVKKHKCCNEVVSSNEACSGGEATCVDKAICQRCNGQYGSLDATNHTLETFIYRSNGDGTHAKLHECCEGVHTQAIDCTGGTASCSKKAVCQVCGGEYGNYLAHSYTDGICTACGMLENDFLYKQVNASLTEDAEGIYVLFGRYPQSKVTDSALISALNTKAGTLPTAEAPADWINYGYYANGDNTTAYMWYIDKGHDGERYRGVYFTSYRPNYLTYPSDTDRSYQDDNGYEVGTVYWFRWDPIQWRILTRDFDHDNDPLTHGEALLLAELALDNGSLHNEAEKVYFAESAVRSWLFDTFYRSAFNELQKQMILTSAVYGDAVFLPTRDDLLKPDYGFVSSVSTHDPARAKPSTDYAMAQGANTRENGFVDSWLISPYDTVHYYCVAGNVGAYVGESLDKRDNTHLMGIVPAVVVHLHTYDVQTATAGYHASDADCTHSARYYTSCRCGASSEGTIYENTFAVGKPLGHTGGTATCSEQAVCTRCAQPYGNTLPHTILNGFCTVCGQESVYIICDADGTPDCDGDYMLFGSYPQTRADSATEESLTSTYGTNLPTEGTQSQDGWTSYGYYKNGVNTQHYTWYKDVTVGGVKYRGVYFVEYRAPYLFWERGDTSGGQYKKGYRTSTVYWFKWEPILWKITEDGAGGLLLVSTCVLDTQFYKMDYDYRDGIYYVPGTDYYLNNYEHSDIRAWLNDDFYNTAFGTAQKANILLTEVDNSLASTGDETNPYICDNTNDYVFLLSRAELESNSGLRNVTDYSYVQGNETTYQSQGETALRTPYNGSSNYSLYGNSSATKYTCCYTFSYPTGNVVPALRFDLNRGGHRFITYEQNDSYHYYTCSDCGKFVKQAHSFDENKVCTVCGYEAQHTLGLDIRDYGTYIGVSGIGTATDTDIVIPETYDGKPVTKIDGSAFKGNLNITSVTIPTTVTEIPVRAFENCTSLRAVNLNGGLQTIGFYAFKGCTSLESIVIPDSVTEIGTDVFNGCTGLTSMTVPFLGKNAETPDDLGYLFGTSYPSHADKVPAGLTSVTITGGTTLANYAFRDCASLVSITLPDGITSIGYGAFWNCTSLTNITIPDGVTSIPVDAFRDCASLTSIVIPESVTSIGSSAFRDCASLTSIVIPDSVTEIGRNVFNGCTGLTSMTVPFLGQYVETPDALGYLFSESGYNGHTTYVPAGLTSVTITGGTALSNDAFRDCASLVSITLPDSLTGIGNNAFYGCTSLVSITIPESVTSIGSAAFQDCVSLTSIVIPDGVDSISSNAFCNCTKLASVVIPDGVTSIGDYAFSNCASLANMVIPDSVTSIGSAAFQNCDSLTSIVIPDGVTSICDYAFINCASLANMVIPDSVTSIGSAAFQNCDSLTSIVIPDGLQSISYYVFRYCDNLTSIVIPDSVTNIGNSTFQNSTEVFYKGTAEQWNIAIGANYVGATKIYYYSALEPAVSGDYWHYVDSVVPTKW